MDAPKPTQADNKASESTKEHEMEGVKINFTRDQKSEFQRACEFRGVPMASKARELMLSWARAQTK